MKKYLLLAVLVSVGIATKAQIIGSETKDVVIIRQEEPQKPKKHRKFKWNVRAGYSIDQYTGLSERLGSTSGIDAGFGIVWPFGDNGLFWGADATGTTMGASIKNKKQNMYAWGFSISPYIGIRLPLGKSVAIAPHVGPYIACAWGYYNDYQYNNTYYKNGSTSSYYISNYDGKIYQESNIHFENKVPDVGVNVGVSFFLTNNFYIDIRCKKGFIPSDWFYHEYGYTEQANSYTTTSLGYSWPDYNKVNYENNFHNKKVAPLKIIFGLGFQF